MLSPFDWLCHALTGAVIVDIGQLTPADRELLERAVRRGALVKWRGHFAPVPGAAHGFGPQKTCYGKPATLQTAARH